MCYYHYWSSKIDVCPITFLLLNIKRTCLVRGVTIPSLPPLIYSFSNKPSLQKYYCRVNKKKTSITFSRSVPPWSAQHRRVLLFQIHSQPQSYRIQDPPSCSSSHSWFLFNFVFNFYNISVSVVHYQSYPLEHCQKTNFLLLQLR